MIAKKANRLTNSHREYKAMADCSLTLRVLMHDHKCYDENKYPPLSFTQFIFSTLIG